MSNWINKHLTISVMITLLFCYGVGAAWASSINLQISNLKTMPERMARLEQKVTDIKESVIRIERYLIK